jgi:hypothetical protein
MTSIDGGKSGMEFGRANLTSYITVTKTFRIDAARTKTESMEEIIALPKHSYQQ